MNADDVLDQLWRAFATRQPETPAVVPPQLLADAHSTLYRLAAELEQLRRDTDGIYERLVGSQWLRDSEATQAATEIAQMTRTLEATVDAHRRELDRLTRDENERWTRHRRAARRERREQRAAVDAYRRAVEALPVLIRERRTLTDPKYRAVVDAQLLDTVCERIADASRTYDAKTAAVSTVTAVPEGISA